MIDLCIKDISINTVEPYTHNARIHSKQQIDQIAKSIESFGFLVPILVDKRNQIIAGHGRVDAAQQLGIKKIPVIKIEHLTDAQKRAYIIADNKLTENAGWDLEALSIEFQELSNMDLDFSLDITGFDTPEINLMLDIPDNSNQEDSDIFDDVLSKAENNPRCQSGDMWMLGEHRIVCGDSLNKLSLAMLMLDQPRATMVFTDPPYNVNVQGHITKKAQHEEFAMASGEMSSKEFTLFLKRAINVMQLFSVDGSIHYICMDWRHMPELLKASESYNQLKNLCVWVKDNGGMGSFYRSQHEFVFVYKHGTAPHINNFELGQHGRYRTNVWQYAGMNNPAARIEGDLNLLDAHPTVKPVLMIEDAIKDCSHRGDIVLDPFLGSGSTLIAAENTGRICYGVELEPKYVDVILTRWENLTGNTAHKIKMGGKHDG